MTGNNKDVLWPLFWIAVVVAILLLVGEPDIIDAVIAWIGRQP